MDDSQNPQPDVPWPQKLFNSIWLLALAAMLYFFLSYVFWGLVNLWQTPQAG